MDELALLVIGGGHFHLIAFLLQPSHVFPIRPGLHAGRRRACLEGVAQFITVYRRSKWSSHRINSPLRALLATEGSKAACKINAACSNAFWDRKFRRN